VEALQALAATREQREQRRASIERERAEVASRREKANAEQTRHQQNLRKLADVYRPLAEQLVAREGEQQVAEQAVRAIETRLQQHREARKLSGSGNCPFLREPCKNIQQRGEHNLGAYFDRLIATEEQALTPALAQRDAAAEQVARARKAAELYSRYDEYRGQLEQAESQMAECDTAHARLTAEMREIAQALATAGDQAGLAEAQRLLRLSQEADKRLATLPAVQRTLDEQRARLRELTDELAQLETTLAGLADAPAAQQAAEAELARLGDPRTEVAGKQALANARPEAEQRLTQADEQRRIAEAGLARLDIALAPYASLDADIAALDAEIVRARPGHTRYLQHENAAAQLAEREREHAAAITSEATTAREAQATAAALAEAQRRFDGQALAEADARAKDLRSRQGSLRETLAHTEAALAALDHQIAHGEELLAELERAGVERGELAEMRTMLEQFRDTIREAGPLVTQRLLGQISTEANAIFGEVIGDHSATLAWVDEYEITLTRNGVQRTFALLSGGEQMAAALATRLALLRRLTGLDLAFFDEPTQNMDSERRSALAEQIRRVRGFEQLIVISHDDTFEQGLDSVIHLEKRNGVTVVSDDDTAFSAAAPFAIGLDVRDEPIAGRLVDDLSALLAE
jgi:exonuclease SbcC